MTHNGYARSIRPVHTSADGDSIYALSVGNIPADCDMVGTLAADVMAEAILCAIRNSESAYGLSLIHICAWFGLDLNSGCPCVPS